MQCPTCKRMEPGEWLFARSSPSQDLSFPLPPPPLGRVVPPVLRQSRLPPSGPTILPEPVRSTSTVTVRLNGPRRESSSVGLTQQHQLAANISRTIAANVSRTLAAAASLSRTIAANEHRIHRTMYVNEIRSSGGRGRSAVGMATASGGGGGSYSRVVQMATMTNTMATASRDDTRRSGGGTSRNGGPQQFWPSPTPSGGGTSRTGGGTSRSSGPQQFRPMATARGSDTTRSGGGTSRSGGSKQFRPRV